MEQWQEQGQGKMLSCHLQLLCVHRVRTHPSPPKTAFRLFDPRLIHTNTDETKKITINDALGRSSHEQQNW
jgi:hypothetical protein